MLQASNEYVGRVREAWLGISAILWASCAVVGVVGVIGAPGIGIKILLGVFAAFAGCVAIQKGQEWRDYPLVRRMFDRRWFVLAIAEQAVALLYVGATAIFWADVLFVQCVLGIVLLSAWQIVRTAWGWLMSARGR